MTADLLRTAVRAFRIAVDGSGSQPGGQSGAGIFAARTATGAAAYLKVTAAGPAARRELRFYREVAPVVPVRTPPLLASLDHEDGVALLLADAGRTHDPGCWPPQRWSELGAALAALHAMPVPPEPRWRWRDEGISAVGETFWTGRLPELADVVADRARLRAAIDALPPVFVHGDCHTGNLLHGPGGLVFCDWQSARVGSPAADLAFLSVRAAPTGATVPPALLDAYLRGSPADPTALRRALIAEELTTFVHHWPPHAPHNTPTGIDRVIRRTRQLARHWLAG
jgi:hypothetical protein